MPTRYPVRRCSTPFHSYLVVSDLGVLMRVAGAGGRGHCQVLARKQSLGRLGISRIPVDPI